MPFSLKGVIFDFDGPIFDGRAASQQALAATFEYYAAQVGRPAIAMTTLPLYGPGALIALAYANTPAAAPMLADIRDFYSKALNACEGQSTIVAGILPILQHLKGRGITCAILSSRKTAALVERVTALGLRDLFGEIWGGDTPAGQKPDPAAVLALANQLKIAPANLIYVGDSDRDFDATIGTDIAYCHAAWSGEPSSRAFTRCRTILHSVADLEAVVHDKPSAALASHRTMPPNLQEAIDVNRLVFYAGAGVSVQSGIGGWLDHYFPILQQLNVSLWAEQSGYNLPQLLQLAAATPMGSENVYNSFKKSFAQRGRCRPNPYHYAMMRSRAFRIWTTNYDRLFEAAVADSNLPHRIVSDDASLLENFSESQLIIKMNGDFEHSKYANDLDWNVVFLEEQFDLAERERREIWRLFEDDYRSGCMVFVGTSFTDPALRRLLSNAAKAVPRTRFWHHLLVKAARHPADRVIESMYVENLKRMRIETHLFDDYPDIERWVRQIAVIARRPIIGLSGTAKQDDKGVLLPEGAFDDGALKGADINQICERLGRGLVRRSFRVTSGHGPGVGVPAVESAFEENPNAARFYLRKRGSSQFSRTAPAVVVPSDSFGPMRDRFIGEIDLLVAIGGQPRDGGMTGTEIEIDMALERSIPVIILKQAGGSAAQRKPEMMTNLAARYSDPKVAALVGKINRDLDAVPLEALLSYVEGGLIDQIEDLIAVSVGSAGSASSDGVSVERRWL